MMRLRRARELAGLTIARAAERIGFHRGTVRNLEAGDFDPEPTELDRMASVYGVSLEWLRGDDVPLSEAERGVLAGIEHTGDRARVAELLASLPRKRAGGDPP